MSGRKKLKVLLDTNIWISGILFSGNEEKIVDYTFDGKFQSIIPFQLIDEFKRVMIDKFKLSHDDVLDSINENIQVSEILDVEDFDDIEVRDLDDKHIVKAAKVSQCDFLVTGDKDIKVLGSIEKTKIISSKEFLKILEKE
jgi:putative PIN family toxin of toxin-antitoxin system